MDSKSTVLDRALGDSQQLVHAAYENRVAAKATVPLGGSGAGLQVGSMQGLLTQSASQKHAEHYRHFRGWPYAAIRAITFRIASQELNIAIRTGSVADQASFIFGQKVATLKAVSQEKFHDAPPWVKRGPGNLQMVESHPLLDALTNPNPAMSGWQLMSATVASLELAGKGYWVFSPWPDDESRNAIWYIPAHWMEPSHKNGLFAEYVIRNPGMTGGQGVTVPGDMVAYFSLPCPSGMWESKAPIDAQRMSVETDEAILAAQRAGFENQGIPGLILRVGRLPGVQGAGTGPRPHLTAEQRAQLFDVVLGHYESVLNHREPLLLDGLIDGVERLTRSPEEMDYTESGKGPESRILRTFGTNAFVLGEMESANRASAAAAEQNLCDGVINPLLALMGQVLSPTIGGIINPQNPGSVRTWYDPCHARDRELKLREWTQASRAGMVGIDEFRDQVLGLAPLPNGIGKALIVPTNMAMISTEDGTQVAVSPGSDGEDSASVVSFESMKKSARSSRPRINAKDGAALATGLFIKQAAKHERSIERVVKNFLLEENRRIIKAVAGKSSLTPADVADAGDVVGMRSRLIESVVVPIAQAMAEGAMAEAALVEKLTGRRAGTRGAKADLVDLDPEDFAMDIPPSVMVNIRETLSSQFAMDYWDDIAKNSVQEIQEVVQAGLDLGWDAGRIERSMRDKFIRGPRPAIRARTIARTESGAAVNAGHMASIEEMEREGLVSGKQWLSVCSNKTRPWHCALSGRSVRPATTEGRFILSGGGRSESTPYPKWHGLSGLNRANCMCTIISGDVLGGAGAEHAPDELFDGDFFEAGVEAGDSKILEDDIETEIREEIEAEFGRVGLE